MAYVDKWALAYDNYAILDGTTISCNQSFSISSDNLKDPNREIKCRIAATTNISLDFNLGSAMSVDFGALLGTNLTSAAALQFRSSSDNFSTNNVEEDNFTWGAAPYSFPKGSYLASTVTKQYWRWVIADASNPDGFIEIGLPCLAPIVQFGANYNYEWEMDFPHESRIGRSGLGVGHLVPAGKWRRAQFDLGKLTEAEGDTLTDALVPLLGETPCWLLLDPLNSTRGRRNRRSMYGVFTNIGTRKEKHINVIMTNRLTFEDL